MFIVFNHAMERLKQGDYQICVRFSCCLLNFTRCAILFTYMLTIIFKCYNPKLIVIAYVLIRQY